MNLTATTLILSISFCYGYAQPARTDSLTNLIENAADNNEKGRLLILRSKAWPNVQIDNPLADAQAALALYQQTKKEEGQVDAYLQLSGIYSRQNKFRLALDVDSATYLLATKASYKKGMALALSNIGRNHLQLGNVPVAEPNLLRAMQLLQEAGLEPETALVHNILGTLYMRLSNMEKALHHFDGGIAVARKFKAEPILAQLLMNNANCLNSAAKYDDAIALHLQSIRIKEKMKDERGLMQSYNNIAIPYMRAGEYATSLLYYRKGLVLCRQYNNKSSIGFNSSNMANLFIRLKQLDSVPFFYEQAVAAFKETEEKSGLALAYHNYGHFLMDQKKYNEAKVMLERALELRRQIKSPYEIASTMNVLGSLLTQTSKPKEAEKLLLQSIAILKNENGVLQKDTYVYLANHYKSVGNFEEAYKYQANYLTMKDTLVTENEVTNMLRAQSTYEVEKRDAQIALEKKDKEIQTLLVKQKNGQMMYLLVALGLALLLAFAFFLNYHNKKKHAASLETKNGQIETLIRELHHRVKNNLQVVSGLLSLQSNRMEDGLARDAMEAGRTRVDAMAMIHQKLYLDKELAAVDMKEYLVNLSASLAGSFGFSPSSVNTVVQLPKLSMDIDKAIPIGLIVNELITNAFKHAFTGVTEPKVSISLLQVDTEMQLQISDNGTGVIPTESKPASFGMKLVNTLVNQLDATIETFNQKGTVHLIKISA